MLPGPPCWQGVEAPKYPNEGPKETDLQGEDSRVTVWREGVEVCSGLLAWTLRIRRISFIGFGMSFYVPLVGRLL